MEDKRSKHFFRDDESKEYDFREDTRNIPSTYRKEVPESDAEISIGNDRNYGFGKEVESNIPKTYRIEKHEMKHDLRKRIYGRKDNAASKKALVDKKAEERLKGGQQFTEKHKPNQGPFFDHREIFSSTQNYTTLISEQDCKLKQSCSEKDIRQNNTVQESNAKKYSAYQIALELSEKYLLAHKGSQLYMYMEDEGYWKMLHESDNHRDIRKLIRSEKRNNISKNILYEIYEWLITSVPEMDEAEDRSKYYLNFKDCAVNWKSGEVCVDRKGLFFKYVLQCKYLMLPETSTGAYARFLQDIFGDDAKTRREFRKFMGLCLSDIRNLKYSIFLYGLSNSGKSVVLNLLKMLVGSEWCSSLSFSQMDSEFAITQLLGKRLNLSGEVCGATNKRLDIFKSLTGNDTVTACFKGKDHFQFRNRSLLVFACNDFPTIQTGETLDSILSRIIIFPFLNVKPREEWIDNLEDVLMEDCVAVITDAIKGLRQLEKDAYRFKESISMKKCKDEFIGNYNSFAIFASRHIEADVDSTVTSYQIEKAYINFCHGEGLMALPSNIWPQYLKRKYQCRQRTIEVYKGTEGKRARAYQGIRLINIDQDTNKVC